MTKNNRASLIGLWAITAANLLALSGSIVYLAVPADHTAWSWFGAFLVLVLAVTIAAAAFNRHSPVRSAVYLLFTAVFLPVVPIANTIASLDPANASSRSSLSVGLLILEFLLGLTLTPGRLPPDVVPAPGRHRQARAEAGILPAGRSARPWRRLMPLLILLLLLAGGIWFSYDLLTRDYLGLGEVFIPVYTPFGGLFFLTAAAGAFRLARFRFPALAAAAGILGCAILLVSLIPAASVPFLVKDAARQDTAAFGSRSWPDEVAASFRRLPFNSMEYLYGTAAGPYSVQQDILFYQGTDGMDRGISLYFDAYLPAGDRLALPGRGSVLIRIHGGAWNIGDKGLFNFAQVNKYFASQGYTVFDIQYGLNDQVRFFDFMKTPAHLAGAFSIDDMVRHIGLFTTYLGDHHGEFGADIESVFLSGGSAGGQLALAAGLGLSRGKYTQWLDQRLKIKGIIPFYPANGLAAIGGTTELADPSALVAPDSPPCLIYQGTHDGIVDPQIAVELQKAYLAQGNIRCALIKMPFASHCSDIYFSGYYNQVFLFYMERFLHQYR